MDATALNFNPDATVDNGSCLYPCPFDLTTVSYVGTGSWQTENAWTISDADGTVVAEGSAANWFVDPNISFEVCMDPDGCYTFTLTDTFGDGWNGNSLDAGSFGTYTVNGVLLSRLQTVWQNVQMNKL